MPGVAPTLFSDTTTGFPSPDPGREGRHSCGLVTIRGARAAPLPPPAQSPSDLCHQGRGPTPTRGGCSSEAGWLHCPAPLTDPGHSRFPGPSMGATPRSAVQKPCVGEGPPPLQGSTVISGGPRAVAVPQCGGAGDREGFPLLSPPPEAWRGGEALGGGGGARSGGGAGRGGGGVSCGVGVARSGGGARGGDEVEMG